MKTTTTIMEAKTIELSNIEFVQNKIGMVPSIKELSAIKTTPSIKMAVTKTLRNIKDGYVAYLEARNAIQEQYCVKDDKGKPKLTDKSQFEFETPELEQKCIEDTIALANIKVKVEIFAVLEKELMDNPDVTSDLILRLGEFVIV